MAESIDEGAIVAESGMLVRDGGAFVLRGDGGGRWHLRLRRVPADLVGKRVAIEGREAEPGTIEVSAIRPG